MAGFAVNRPIIIGALGITATGVVSAVAKKRPVTPVIIGGYILTLAAAVVDLVGGQISVLMGGIVLAALFGVILTEVPWDTVLSLVKGSQPAAGGGGHTVK